MGKQKHIGQIGNLCLCMEMLVYLGDQLLLPFIKHLVQGLGRQGNLVPPALHPHHHGTETLHLGHAPSADLRNNKQQYSMSTAQM